MQGSNSERSDFKRRLCDLGAEGRPRRELQLWWTEVGLSDWSGAWAWPGLLLREVAHQLLPGQVDQVLTSWSPIFSLHYISLCRQWSGSLEDNAEAITDLNTDAAFASPAHQVKREEAPFKEVIIVIIGTCRKKIRFDLLTGVKAAQQSGSILLLSARLPLQRPLPRRLLQLSVRRRTSFRLTRRRHPLHLQTRRNHSWETKWRAGGY